MSERLEIHVIGGRKGESIVVRFPGDCWGVVDNYTPVLREPESNRTLQLLKSRNVERLSFLCLTHPHVDHYRGMHHLLRAFSPNRIWIFGATTHRDLYAKVAALSKVQAESSHFQSEEDEAADELVEILDWIRNECRNRQRRIPLEVKRLQLGMSLLKLDSDPPLCVSAVGASGGRALVYEDSLSDCFRPDGGGLRERVPREQHNIISGGLLIDYGQARIILGGDIDREGWKETLNTVGKEMGLRSQLIKVSHHGSSTGYCDGLWEAFSPGRSAVAVLTPYTSQGLPNPGALAHISQHARAVLSSSVEAAALATDWSSTAADTAFAGVSVDALVTLRATFPKAVDSRGKLDGVCSFLVSDDGRVEFSFSGSAGRLSGT